VGFYYSCTHQSKKCLPSCVCSGKDILDWLDK
jgi:hypothetical protein